MKQTIFGWCLVLATVPSVAHEVSLEELPLGDGYVVDSPAVGSVFACRTRFNPNAPGAHRSGDWLGTDTFDLTRKPTVDGRVTHVSELSIELSGNRRVIDGNGLPNHPTGVFPIRRTDDAYRYDRNPGSIREQTIALNLPVSPGVAAAPSCLPMGAIGIMTSGAVLFNALDARGEDALAHEIMDGCHGHPQQQGVYHYHGKSPCLEDPAAELDHSGLIGYAFDGFGIYGLRGEDGKVLSTKDLDECHGHTGTIEWDGVEVSMYHYHATLDYPYTLSCFRGKPIESTVGRPQGPPGGDRSGRRPPRGRRGD